MDIGDDRGIGVARVASFSQQRLWFLDQLRPGSADYLLPLALRIRGDLDVVALTGALTAIVDRHEVLRTRYVAVDGEPVPHIEDEVDIALAQLDLTRFAPDERERRVAELTERELRRPFDLAVAPPLRLTLARLAADDHFLLLVVHHIAFDFWSWGVLARELAAGYRERIGGAPADLPPLPMQYADFAEWQCDWLTGPRLSRRLDHWRSRLAGLPPLELPTDRPRPPVWEGTGGVVRFDLPSEVVAAVDRLARANRATRFMVLLAAFQALLARYTGQTDLAVGTPVAGRSRIEVEGLLGLFVNTVVLRTDLSGQPSFIALLHRVRDSALAAFSNADAPFERIVTELTPERDLSRNPLFQVSFSLLNGATDPISLPGLDVDMVGTPPTGTPFDLLLDLVVCPDGRLAARLQYATALFDKATMECLGDGYLQLLRGVLADPDTPVRHVAQQVDMLPAKERRRLLARGNDTGSTIPDLTVSELFERQALSTPDAVAVRSADLELSYADLDARTNQLAHHLRALGVGPGTLVGIYLDRCADLVVAFLAVLKAGGAYVPIDPEYPGQRIAFLLADAGAQLMISQESLAGGLAETAARTVLLDRDRDEIAARPRQGLGRTCTPADLAYVIYTSGSTGTPKGIMIHHRGLTNFLVSMLHRPGLRPGVPVIGLTTVSFDPSVLELYLPLLVGAHVVVASTEEARDPQRMARLIAGTDPALLQATPTTLRMLLDSGWSAPPGLTVLSGGEKLSAELVERLAANGATVWDLYGPTETTVWATTARLAADGRVVDWAPAANSTVYLLDARQEPVPDGAIGEVYIGGAGVAWGYHGRPALTAETFVPDPHATEPGVWLYRTGDLARRHPNGSIEILGRRDHQVKIRGHRMEPGEIEAALLAHDRIRAAVVHPTPTESAEPQLTAYLVPHGDDVPTAEQLRDFLLRTLPDYMTPAAYVVLDTFPLTPSGKIDRKALPVPESRPGVADGRDHVAPRTSDERTVADVWREVLGGSEIGVHENFFDIGGHSLVATRVAVRLRATLGIDVPVRALFDHSTVAALAGALTDYPRVSVHGAMPVLAPRRRAGAGRGASR